MASIPLIDINFPAAREKELLDEMNRLAVSPWSPQSVDPHDRPREENRFYIHRDAVGTDPPSTVCLCRKSPGHWQVVAVVPDEGHPNPPVEAYLRILSAFDAEIAGPAAEALEGLSAMGASKYRLDDHFSPQAVKLLERFCKTSNMGDGGSHPSDQEKWIDFLLCVHDDGADIHCDVFRYCLRESGWWYEQGIPRLVHDFDFAMRLLKQSGR